MKIATDLHIHSCLSPCGDDDMTPNNIVGMAAVKGLDAIAVCDHNSALNLPACARVAEALGVVLVPGIEVQPREEAHILCYFPTVETALAYGEILHEGLLIPNKADLFGEQQVMNEDDEVTGHEAMLLAQSADVSLDEVVARVTAMGGVAMPAHINRQSNSILYNLGFIPPGVFQSVEVSKLAPFPEMDLSAYHVVHSSDAHYLGNIFERENFIEVREKTVQGVLDYLRSAKK